MRGSNLQKVKEALDKMNKGGDSYKDGRMWTPTQDDAGNALAVIRFLPSLKADQLPWVKVYTHGFQGSTGRWYIEKCLTTIGADDPVCNYTRKLWNRGDDEGKELARKYKRKLSYYSNVLVVNDPKHPENEGKVFLFRYGAKIFAKITSMMMPELDSDPSVDVFDPDVGANFRLRVKRVAGYANYDDSAFQAPSPISKDDKVLDGILSAAYDLGEFLKPESYKSFDELDAKFHDVLQVEGKPETATREATWDKPEAETWDEPKAKSVRAPRAESKPAPEPVMDDDDPAKYFEQFAK